MLAKRLTEIMNILEKEETASVSSLAKRCGVTEKTIRQDLDKLVKLNMATRVHGGAFLTNSCTEIYPVLARKQKYISEKRLIAQTALGLIEDGDTIFLDAGSTVLELARLLNKDVIVITNDALIAAELLEHKSVTLYCTGGLLQRNNGSYPYVGPDAIHLISRYRTRKCFMGCSALNFTHGLMVFSGIEAEIKSEIIKASDQVICLADYSKFHKTAFSSFLPLEEVSVCVTNAAIPGKDVEFLKSKNIDVRIAR